MKQRYTLIRSRQLMLMLAVTAAVLAGLVITAFAASGMATHLDRSKNPGGCASCHQDLGRRTLKPYDICFSCHGTSAAAKGLLAKTELASVFNKRYKHPIVDTAGVHRPAEELPEKNAGTPRHVACEDCHKIHEVTAGKPLVRITGYSRSRARVKEAQYEYEICYNCHADSVNLPLGAKNKRLEFDQNNLSYHPVEGVGKNMRVPSLTKSLNVMSTITCTSCHGNDDTYGPRGPHGSNIAGMLRYEYVRHETAESPVSYALCYSCHDRGSILNNASFKTHKEHIVYNHIPCSACHVSHGTEKNQHLIEFSTDFVGFVPLPTYMPTLDGRPTCLLKCHTGGRDVVHDSAFYSARGSQRFK